MNELMVGLCVLAGCFAFCIIFNIHGNMRFLAPLGGLIAWVVYSACGGLHNTMLQAFLAAMAGAVYSEVMARIQKEPATGYLLISLIALVPGGGIYYTMEYCLANNSKMFFETGLNTLGTAGALALGVLLVSSATRLFHTVRAGQASHRTDGAAY